jgi:hypothetical protein
MKDVYHVGKEERDRRGMLGRTWVTSDESMMSADNMSKNVMESVDHTISNFTSRKKYYLLDTNIKDKKTLAFPLSI